MDGIIFNRRRDTSGENFYLLKELFPQILLSLDVRDPRKIWLFSPDVYANKPQTVEDFKITIEWCIHGIDMNLFHEVTEDGVYGTHL